MKIYGHPWSINTRKTLMTLEEKGAGGKADLVLIMIPKGEQKLPEHVARHPWGKVPVLEDDDGFMLLETRAINAYIDRKFGSSGTSLTPKDSREQARVDQWINVAESYFIPHAHALVVEILFRRYLGGEQNKATIETSRATVKTALEVFERWLADHPYFAGNAFSLADIHYMPYFEYLSQIGEGNLIDEKKNVARWWSRVSSRPTWQKVARSGPQPYEQGMTADVVEKLYR
jgi:glutathione S-transferase